jgi:uncharacterized repeat protein (TIGR03803 family)
MNSKKRLTLRVSMMCFGIALGALGILSLVSVAHTVRAQNAPAETVVFSFTDNTGYDPTGVINGTAGSLYVATQEGGSNQSCTDGCGNVLKLSPPGKATVLYTFTSALEEDSEDPVGLTRNANGILYGITGSGGYYNLGTLFELAPSGEEKTLHSFGGVDDGFLPDSVMTIDSLGNLYGTTILGGANGRGSGTIYKATPSGSETILYRFNGGADGGSPYASPILDAEGNLYGTAVQDGDLRCSLDTGAGCGTVWKLDPSGNLTVLYTFMGGTDGALPKGGLVMDPSGNLYGDTESGGDFSCNAPYGCGTVFEIGSSGNFAVLHAFTGGSSDGQEPLATLVRDSSGNLYGTAFAGGDQSCSWGNGAGCGVVFEINASNNETILHIFGGGTADGAQPTSAVLVSDGKGNLYGTTQYGGTSDDGVVFKVRE